MKTCSKCKTDKEAVDFSKSKHNKDGIKNWCKLCVKIYNESVKETRNAWQKEYNKEFRITHKEQIKIYRKNYNQEHREENATYAKIYRKNNKQHFSEYRYNYEKERMETDVDFKLTKLLRNRLRSAVKRNQKGGSSVQDLGCSVPELKLYLESQFQEGMSWNNWSPEGWHIDHIHPLSRFDLTDREQFLKACHYTNLQPLWAQDNLRKSNKT